MAMQSGHDESLTKMEENEEEEETLMDTGGDPLELGNFENEETNNLMISDGDFESETKITYVTDTAPQVQGEQFLTMSQGMNQISVNDDGSIVVTDGSAGSSERLTQCQTQNDSHNTFEDNTFYIRSNDSMEDHEDTVQSQGQDSFKEFSGTPTYYINNADGTLTEVHNSHGLNMGPTLVKKSDMANFITVHPEVRPIKRPAGVASSLGSIGSKVYIQNTPRGQIIRRTNIQKVGGTSTISLNQAQRIGLVGGQNNKVYIKRVSAASGSGQNSVIVRSQNNILPRPVTISRALPIRTIPSLSQIKTSLTGQHVRPITVGKNLSTLSLAARTPQKLLVRPNSGTMRAISVQGSGRQQLQLLKVVNSSGTPGRSNVVSISKTQTTPVFSKNTIGKTVFISTGKGGSVLKSSATEYLSLKGRVSSIQKTIEDYEGVMDEDTVIKLEDDPDIPGTAEAVASPEEEANIDEPEREMEVPVLSEAGPGSPQRLLEANGIRPKKPCNCTKSQCLKLYCECFANGEFCFQCNCNNCFNNIDHEEERQLSIKSCLERNPDAFRRKIQVATCNDSEEDERRPSRGCNCKKSHCLKNYCECFEGKLTCSSSCKCTSCRNTEEDMAAWMRGETIDSGDEGKDTGGKGQPFMPKALAEALCQCILEKAEEADHAGKSIIKTEEAIIEELGQRLVQIIGNKSKRDAR